MMERPSWVCTVFTQLFLCVALYCALNLGQSQMLRSDPRMVRSGRLRGGGGGGALDSHFVTVRGGSRPPYQQTRLLKLMEKICKTFDAKFVINISELGEEDPLLQKSTENPATRKVPWYTTRASNGSNGYYHEQIMMLSGKTLDMVGMDTSLLMDLKYKESSNVLRDEQYGWISRTLEATNGDWRLVVGFHPLISGNEKKDQAEEHQDHIHLQDLLAKFGVNMYLSGMGCTGSNCQDGIAYIENPSPVLKKHNAAARYGTSSIFSSKAVLLLHRVSQLTIVTYSLNIHGEVINRTVIRQQGKEVM